MAQPDLFPHLLWSISDLTRYLKELIESDELLQDVWVLGEVSNFSRPASGHMYFTLKDATASLRCVMWRSGVARLPFLPKEGQLIEAHGNFGVYEIGGQYQLYMDAIRSAGEGVLFQDFLKLKARLEGEGLFDVARKRHLPETPRQIGIVTSPTGAALHDILNTLRRRYPLAEAIISPTPVQGVEAPAGIISAIDRLNRFVHPDVIILARGGGSIEDLWAFNDELVARAIVSSQAPVITGIGHETDFTIADFASDLRAPTPTAAAELATPNRSDLQAIIRDQTQRIDRVISQQLVQKRDRMVVQAHRLSLRSPASRVQRERQHLDELFRRAENALNTSLHVRRLKAQAYEQNLAALNPASVLRRGYAIVRHQAGDLISRIQQVSAKDEITIRLQDGEFSAVAGQELGAGEDLG